MLASVGSGVVNGFALALVSLGFAIVFRATGVVNFANGVQMVLGGYVTWSLETSGHLPAWLAIVGGVIAGVLSGLLLDLLALRPVRGGSLLTQVIVLLAASEAASSAFLTFFGPNTKSMKAYASPVPVVKGVNWSGMDLTVICVSLALVVALALVLRRTVLGLRMRVVAASRVGAMVVGVNPLRISTLAWGIGGGLAALSGALIFPTYLLSPDLGQQYTFDSFAAVVLGGFGSLPGAVLGGLLIGVIQALVALGIGASYSAFVSLAVMLIVLAVRPNGLIGAAE